MYLACCASRSLLVVELQPVQQRVPAESAACAFLQDKSFMFMRNLAAGRSAAECVKQWSGGSAVPALVARMQELPPPQHILVHILYCLSNFASTGQHANPPPSSPPPTNNSFASLLFCNHIAAEARLKIHVSLAVWQSAFMLVLTTANSAAITAMES